MQLSRVVSQCSKTKNMAGTCSLSAFAFIHLLISIGLIKAAPPMKIIFPSDNDEISCEKHRWYHNETEKCWPSRKERGPCPESMIFYPVDNKYGDCDCPEVNHTTVWVYDVASNQCFKTYQQAFCKPGEWLVLDSDNIPTCIPNRCEKLQRENPEENEIHPVVLFNNECVRLLKSSGDCPSPHEVTIDSLTGTPYCSSVLSISDQNIGVSSSLRCRAGTKRDRLGKCRSVTSK